MRKELNVKTNNNLRIMFVRDILFELTDETHLITVNEIMDILKERYDITATRQTIYDDIELLIASGLDIECVKARQNKYRVLSRDFDIAELLLLRDMVKYVKSISEQQTESLVRKICNLAGPSADLLLNNACIENVPKTSNKKVFYIIDEIFKAIADKKQISFKYYDYLTSTDKRMKNNGREYRLSPYKLMCSNDFYYVIGYSEKHEKITAFRIDHISEIPKTINKQCIPEPDYLYTDKYTKEGMHMMTGDDAEVVLECDESVIGNLVDHFGQDLEITCIKRSTYKAKVKVQLNNVFFAWLFGFDGKVRLAGSREVQEQYVRRVSKEMARL